MNVHSGTVTTIAGDGESGDDDGIGTNAQFKFPHGLALTTDDATLYVAGGPSGSTGRGTVRAVDTGDLTVAHVAGLVGGGLFAGSIATDGDATSATFSAPGAVALSPDHQVLYVSEIVKIRTITSPKPPPLPPPAEASPPPLSRTEAPPPAQVVIESGGEIRIKRGGVLKIGGAD